MRDEKRWDELADKIGSAYQELELYIATRDLRLANAMPMQRAAIFEEGTLRLRAISEAVEELVQFDMKNLS